jgi:hypothetical protein
MQLTSSFILLLGSLFAIAQDAHAVPLGREQTGVVTLPLKRASMRRDLPPRIVSITHLEPNYTLIITNPTAPSNAQRSLP